jgi:excisionase family DNA binding protein
MPRMRTIDGVADYFQQIDSETAITKTALRRLVVSGALPSVRVGKKYLIDLDQVEIFLSSNTTSASDEHTKGVIRRAV